MNPEQIGLKLAMDFLGIEICLENYQYICDVVFLARKKGIHLTSKMINYSPKTGHAFSPMSHEDGGYPSANLYTDLDEIAFELERGDDESADFVFDDITRTKMHGLENKLILNDMEVLLRNAA